MKISQILKTANDNFGISKIIDDREFNTLGLASAEVDLKFCTFIESEKYIDSISKNVTMIITKAELANQIQDKGICISENPRISFFKLHNYLSQVDDYIITKGYKTQIGNDCIISPLAYIAKKNVKIGNNVIIEEFVSIKENTVIGDNTIIRAGTVIGGEGFEFKRLYDGHIIPVKHVGWTVLGDNVEIQHNTCVEKAIYPWDITSIGNSCKIDDLVQVGHGVKLSHSVFIAAGSYIGGRTKILENTWIGLGAIVSNGLIIGKNSSVNIGAVVTRNVENGESVSGNFAIDHKKFIEFIKSIR